jgi:hypothetical protein
MREKSTTSIICLILGFILAGIAIFANVFGVNQHSGWSRARFVFLIFGVVIAICTILYYRYPSKLHSTTRQIQSVIQNLSIGYYTLPIAIIVFLTYAWLGSSGKWDMLRPSTYYYDNLAKGFQNGNFYLPIDPDPQLLLLPNPYDLSARAGIEVPLDLSLYKGKFYMYWEPVPALIIIAIKSLKRGLISDSYLTFGFVCGMFMAQFLFIVAIWRRFFNNLPKWTLQISLLLAGLVGPTIFMRHNYDVAKIYEAAITGGQFFLMCGFLALYYAMKKPSPSWILLVLAGSFWALAIGTRLILVIPVGAMTLTTGYFIFISNGWEIKNINKIIPLALPLMFGLASVGWYNWIRFGSLTETGFYYHLAGWDVRKYSHEIFSPIYIPQNIYNSIFHPFSIKSEFPFINMEPGVVKTIIPSLSLPGGYVAQAITGVLFFFPFAIFSIISFPTLFTEFFHRKSSDNYTNNGEQSLLNWIILSLLLSFMSSFGLTMIFLRSAMRFSDDFLPSLMLASIIGFWHGYRFFWRNPFANRLYAIIGALFASVSILLSTLLAISTNSGLVKHIVHSFPFLP